MLRLPLQAMATPPDLPSLSVIRPGATTDLKPTRNNLSLKASTGHTPPLLHRATLTSCNIEDVDIAPVVVDKPDRGSAGIGIEGYNPTVIPERSRRTFPRKTIMESKLLAE